MAKKIYDKVKLQMEKAIENLKHEFTIIRTGRASTALLEGIRVAYYGAQVPITQVANVVIPEVRLIEIKPWDKSVLPEIEKAIRKSDLGLSPLNDGKIVRLKIPALTEERRRELVKRIGKIAEDHRVELRNIRRQAKEDLKELETKKVISEDERFKATEKIGQLTNEYIGKIDESLVHKEKEIMEV
ncbi:ribosome recycling factor [bacterium]|nr:ribosome recycling factor [bacterium]NIN93025.1 ribosome recycling factor [bacterium]NIO18894.1 ribosome recycling factor [bacterium]NIO73975.1 ribosome recycling factor [bacterium]